MKNTIVAIVSVSFSVLVSAVAPAATYVLEEVPASLSDWKNPAKYQGGAAPSGSPEDIVILPENSTVTVDGTDSGLVGFISGLKAIYVTNAVFSVSVPEGKVVLGCAVTDNSHFSGKLEKLGGGELHLTAWRRLSSSTSPSDYAVNIHVRNGTLRLPDTSDGNNGRYYNMYGALKVDAGAKLISVTKSVWQVRGFAGEGLITNECDSACEVYLTYNWQTKEPFSGELGGLFSINMRQNAYLDLVGVKNTFSCPSSTSLNGTESGATVRIARFGDYAGEPSSIGINGAIVTYSSGMRIIYTGNGNEVTHKTIYALNSPAYLDAGANGGVEFAGDFGTWSTSTGNLQRHLVLDGSNSAECVISGRFDPFGFCVGGGATNHWYISKRGTGTWRFTADDHKHLVGTFAVENGVLAFDSVYEKGLACALGTSVRTYPYHIGSLDEMQPSDYAFELGSADNPDWTGLMEYRGAGVAQCLDRRFALVGNGGFRSCAGAGAVRYADVTGVGDGAKTLVLDGSSGHTNSVYNISEGDGKVSISKRGDGIWALGGEVDVSGDVEVLGGTLVVRREPQRYTRYRFVLKEIAAENPGWSKDKTWTQTYGYWCFNEIALYNKDGIRQNFHLSACGNRAELAPGQAAFATDRSVTKNVAKMSIAYLFDGLREVEFEDGQSCWNGFVGYFDDKNPPNRDRKDSYVAVDMYLAADADTVTHYDVANSGIKPTDAFGGRVASAFALYGSVDGVNWDRLSETEFDEIKVLPGSYNWLYGNAWFNDTAESEGTAKHTDGYKLAKTVPDRRFTVLDDIGTVTVANGAKLVFAGEDAPAISSLRLDAGAVGSISGFRFASGGTLELTGEVPRYGMEIALGLEGAGDISNIASWSVKIGGRVTSKKVRARPDGLVVADCGTIITVR